MRSTEAGLPAGGESEQPEGGAAHHAGSTNARTPSRQRLHALAQTARA